MTNKLVWPAVIIAVGLILMPAAVSAAVAGTTTATGTGTATCPSGYRLSGGGYEAPGFTKTVYGDGSEGPRTSYFIRASRPVAGQQAWYATGYKSVHDPRRGTFQDSVYAPRVWAVCVK